MTGFGRKERLDSALENFGRHPLTVVANFERDPSTIVNGCREMDGERRLGGTGFESVRYQQVEHRIELTGLTKDQRNRFKMGRPDHAIGLGSAFCSDIVVNQAIEGDLVVANTGNRSCVIDESSSHRGCFERRIDDQIRNGGRVDRWRIRAELESKQLGIAHDRAESVDDIMTDRRTQVAQVVQGIWGHFGVHVEQGAHSFSSPEIVIRNIDP